MLRPLGRERTKTGFHSGRAMRFDVAGRLSRWSKSERAGMAHVQAGITVSLDGYVTGPDDGPGCGLGVGGERLHYWVMGGPWSYDNERTPGEGMTEADQEFMQSMTDELGAGVCGRGMYEAAGRWGGTNPFEGTL